MGNLIIALIITIAATSAKAQLNNYVYERLESESVQDFTDRVLGEYKADLGQTHPSIEGYWGDESKGKKIIAFTGIGFREYSNSVLVVFQPIDDGKSYVAMVYDGIGEIGRYYEGVISLFYMDVDRSGTKELVLIEKGGIRKALMLETLDDDGELVEFESTACCDYEFNSVILEQVEDQNDRFLPMIKEHDLSRSLDFWDLENAAEVKEQIRTAGDDE